MVVDGDGEEPTGQQGQQAREPKQLVEAAFERGHLPGQVGAEEVPKGLVLGAGVKPLDGVREGLGTGRGPDQDAPESESGAGDGVAELEHRLAMFDGDGVDIGWDYGTGRGIVNSHRTQAPSLEAIARHNPSSEWSLRSLAQLESTELAHLV
jgi:hypothetical protein